MSAVKFLGENNLQLHNVVAARIGRGLRELPAIKGYDSSAVVIWKIDQAFNQYVEVESRRAGEVDKVRLSALRDDWCHVRCVQLLMVNDASALDDAGGSGSTETSKSEANEDNDRLSTIHEGSVETDRE